MDARRGLIDEFAIAAGVLTRFPLAAEAAEPGAIAASGWAFPLVGGGVGALCAAAFFAAALLGLPAEPAALLAVAAGIAATGALHEDGLADTVDGFGGGRDRDRKLAIMRDSTHGTYGIVALLLSIGLRASAIAAIRDPVFAGLALIAAHTVWRARVACGDAAVAAGACRWARRRGGTPEPRRRARRFAHRCRHRAGHPRAADQVRSD